jgi:hypothetical protein
MADTVLETKNTRSGRPFFMGWCPPSPLLGHGHTGTPYAPGGPLTATRLTISRELGIPIRR